MDKLKMAHEYFMKHGRKDSWMKSDILDAWDYADAMQAEADKRKNAEAEKADAEVEEILNGDEVDWRVAPSWAKYWANRNDTALWCVNKPTVTMDCILSNGACSPAPSFGFTGSHVIERK